jgi:hypothetical protein
VSEYAKFAERVGVSMFVCCTNDDGGASSTFRLFTWCGGTNCEWSYRGSVSYISLKFGKVTNDFITPTTTATVSVMWGAVRAHALSIVALDQAHLEKLRRFKPWINTDQIFNDLTSACVALVRDNTVHCIRNDPS